MSPLASVMTNAALGGAGFTLVGSCVICRFLDHNSCPGFHTLHEPVTV